MSKVGHLSRFFSESLTELKENTTTRCEQKHFICVSESWSRRKRWIFRHLFRYILRNQSNNRTLCLELCQRFESSMSLHRLSYPVCCISCQGLVSTQRNIKDQCWEHVLGRNYIFRSLLVVWCVTTFLKPEVSTVSQLLEYQLQY